MRLHLAAVLFAAAVSGIPLAGPTAAAPDKTQGVAFMSAVVAENGTLKRGSGTESVAKIVVGNYDVTFQRSISACTWSVGIGEAAPGSQVAFGFAYAFQSVADNHTVGVQTRTSGGALADLPFHLIVFCAR